VEGLAEEGLPVRSAAARAHFPAAGAGLAALACRSVSLERSLALALTGGLGTARKVPNMLQMMIKLAPAATSGPCGVCGKPLSPATGPGLCLDESPEAVCRDCGKNHAPALAALLDLAHVADRVGRIGRHTLVPPLDALLDLARAAENYNHTRHKAQKRAA
jgi:hypothetical protein